MRQKEQKWKGGINENSSANQRDLKTKHCADVDLVDGYEKYLVFYPIAESGPYLNIRFLAAELEAKSIRCRNADGTFEHELWIIQFNHPLPPIFKIEPWQILVEGYVRKQPAEKNE